jgi:hypothetical protein
MKLLIVDNFHHKNMKGLEMVCRYLKWHYAYKHGNIIDIEKEIPNYDVIYFPVRPYDASRFPNKRFIFGPHFSVFPDNRLFAINNRFQNAIYIQPSEWAAKTWVDIIVSNINQAWIDMTVFHIVPIKQFAFPVDTERFSCADTHLSPFSKTKVFIYFKSRDPNELKYVEKMLLKLNSENVVEYKVFDYRKRYNEEDYLLWLKQSKYGIWVGCHESQGFALEEALSCDVPLLVWNVKSMNQEYGSRYADIPATSISYWDERCGEYFYKESEFMEKYNKFISKLSTYKPREFVLENLSVEVCGERFKELINL